MARSEDPKNARKIKGWALIGIGMVGLLSNGLWLWTGDIHRRQLHIVMRGGWAGCWLTTCLDVVIAMVGVFFLMLPSEPSSKTPIRRGF